MHLSGLLPLQALWTALSVSTQHFPSWGHYDLCKTPIHWDHGRSWDYMACQPEAELVSRFLRVRLDPPNSTCGETPEMYCTLENPYMCNNECDARTPELAHPPELMLDHEGRIPNTFWQSVSWRSFPEPLLVNITLSWGKTIELTEDIVITFESGRPEQMVLEKSLDHGRTWQPYQFYAADCLNSFGMERRTVRDLSPASVLDIICTEEYSRGYVWKVDKTVRFEIRDRFALFGGPRLRDMASLYGQLDTTKDLRDFFTLTDLRVRLLRPATGATSVDQLNLSKYFYAISNLEMHGRCKCNLHTNNCILEKGKLSCECEHNTTGPDCGRCKKGFQGRPWRAGSYLPIPKGTANICLPNTVASDRQRSPMSLDPKTANWELVLSDDLRSVTRTGQKQPYPPHPERFKDHPQVLCSQSFSSGSHSWDVETDGSYWRIGMVCGSVERKGGESVLGISSKSWCLYYYSGDSLGAGHNSQFTPLRRIPSKSRIRVQLDHEAGTVSFHQVTDSLTHLHTFQTTFTEPVFPAFYCWNKTSLKLLN